MEVPLELTFKDVEKSDAIVDLIYEKIEKLEQVCDNIISCHVIVEKPQEHQETGNPYRVRLDVRVPPGHEVVVKREPGESPQHDPLEIVIRDVFDIGRRRLRSLMERLRKDTKVHPDQQAAALIEEINADEGYGFLKTVDGRRIYFHKNSVLHGDFERLEEGTGVRFAEEQGEQGPQATTVQIVDKPGSRISEGGQKG